MDALCHQARARRAHQHEDNELNRRAAAENALFKRMHKEADRQAVNKELCREVRQLHSLPWTCNDGLLIEVPFLCITCRSLARSVRALSGLPLLHRPVKNDLRCILLLPLICSWQRILIQLT